MGKLLRLKDGTEYTATITSTVTDICIPVGCYSDVDDIKAAMTPENLEIVNFDGMVYTDMSVASDRAYNSGSGVVGEFEMVLGIEDRIAAERQAAIDEYTLQLIDEGVL